MLILCLCLGIEGCSEKILLVLKKLTRVREDFEYGHTMLVIIDKLEVLIGIECWKRLWV